jgi:putative DNA primase/helicase
MPNKVRRLASFEGWSDHVASMLVWLGEADPIVSVESAKASDTDRHEVEDLMDAIDADLLEGRALQSNGAMEHDLIKGFLFKASEFVNYIHAKQCSYGRDIKFELHHALLAVSRIKGGSIDARTFGYWLRSVNGQVFSDRRFRSVEKIGKTKASNLWVFERVNVGAAAKLLNIKTLKPYRTAMNSGVPVYDIEEEKAKEQALKDAGMWPTKH